LSSHISHTAAIHSTGEQNLTSLDHAENYKVGDRWAIIVGISRYEHEGLNLRRYDMQSAMQRNFIN
jgi:hypothetical protein